MKIFEKIKILERATIILRIFLLIFSFYLIILTFLPKIEYNFFSFDTQINQETNLPTEIVQAKQRNENWLYIEKSKVSQKIIETNSIKKIHENVWIWPNSPKPQNGGNTVLLAHRYANIGGNRSSTFYNLPEMTIGDRVFLLWDGLVYEYEVFETMVVEPTAVEILENTQDNILTMFTCTPIWTSKQRFVVKSKLLNIWE